MANDPLLLAANCVSSLQRRESRDQQTCLAKAQLAHLDLIDEAIYLRGRIISAYAQVEFLLADLVSKLDDCFPYRIEARIKVVRKIDEMPGYEAYWHDLPRLSDELLGNAVEDIGSYVNLWGSRCPP